MAFGIEVRTRTNPPSRGAATDTGTLFLTGPVAGSETARGEFRSLDEFVAAHGTRTGATIPTYDYLDTFYSLGGNRCIFAPYKTDYGDGLTLLDDPKLGAGQIGVVASPASGSAYQTLYGDMRDLATGTNRVALRDICGSALSIADAEARAALAPENDEYGASFYSAVTIPGPRGVIGADPRQVPASAAIAALCNRVDQDGNPNRAAAGDDYALDYAVGTESAIPTDVERAALFAAGVNAFDDAYNRLVNFGFQTNLGEGSENPYWQFNCSRARMALKARCEARARPFMFQPLDGGSIEGRLGAALSDECNKLFKADAMFAEDGTAKTAYSVEVGSSVNPDTSIAQGELHGVASVVWAPHTKAVIIDLVTVPVGSAV